MEGFQLIWRRRCLLILAGTCVATSGQLLPASADRLAEGERLARVHCASCHLFPEAEALDRATWRDQILPRMKWRLGFSTEELEQNRNVRLLRAERRIPLEPVITEEQWLTLIEFYLERAPIGPVGRTDHPVIAVGLPGFEVIVPPYRADNPAVTAIKALPGGGVLLADAATKRLQVLNSTGTPCAQLELGNVVSSIRVAGSNLIVSGLGSFVPSDDTDGGVYLLQWAAGGLTLAQRLLSNLPRTTDAFLADVDGNGTKDCVASLFGNNLGRFSWFGPRTDGTYAETVLFALPGALRSEWADVDRDGRPDLTVLVAQETEALLLFHNLGAGRFEQRVLFQRPPFWGHSYFESADFNRDGRPDFLVANGDNGEFVSPPKAVHGVRIYTAQDDSTWRETYFYPMHGAYKAIARDFDGDGDLDIAAISYFPDYRTAPRESFVLLLNQGDGRFRPFTFAESALGRWICMDVGDWDGDGADDILLGSCIKGPTAVPAKLMEAWKSARLPLVVLRHTSGPARATTKP